MTGVLQCVAVRCSVLRCGAVYCVLQHDWCVAVRCSVLQCVAVYCSLWQYIVCCSMTILCVAAWLMLHTTHTSDMKHECWWVMSYICVNTYVLSHGSGHTIKIQLDIIQHRWYVIWSMTAHSRHNACDVWYVTRYITYHMWCVTCDMWHVIWSMSHVHSTHVMCDVWYVIFDTYVMCDTWHSAHIRVLTHMCWVIWICWTCDVW